MRLITVAVIALTSCGMYRPETPEYFQQVTGIPLCPEAKIRNLNLDQAAQAGIGFLYQVELRLDENCREAFERSLRSRNLPPDETMTTQRTGTSILFTYSG